MKKLFAVLIAFALVFTACETPDTENNGTAETTLAIINMSDYNLYNVEYSSVVFGTIDRGRDVTNEVNAGTRHILFSLQTDNGIIRCRTTYVKTCVEGRNIFEITNGSHITTVVTERGEPLKNLFNILNNEPANPKIKILYENYPVASGGTIPLHDIGKGQKQTITLEILNEGEHDLQITGTKPQISGANAEQVTAENYSSLRLAYGEVITLLLDYTPSVNGNNSFTITVINNDQENGTFSIDVTANVKNTWQRLYGSLGTRYGLYRAISNGQGGIYAGGYTGSRTAALFNIDGNGNLQNTFPFWSIEGTVGPVGIGSEYNNYFTVLEGLDGIGDSYRILKTNNTFTVPNVIAISGITFNEKTAWVSPMGIIKSGNYYYVAGGADFYNSPRATITTQGVFIDRLNSDLNFDKGMLLAIANSDITSQSFEARGIAMLSNGDILLYGGAVRNGRDIAFAVAVDVSAVNARSWNIRWSNYYEISGKSSWFYNHFLDNSSNIVLLGETDGGGFVVKFPISTATAAAAKPAGWPKVIAGTDARFRSGLAINDGSGYLFTGMAIDTYGGQDVWVVKTDINVATKQWEQFFGGAGNEYADAVIEQSDGFIIAGSTQSPVIAGQARKGTEDIYLLKINKDGTMD